MAERQVSISRTRRNGQRGISKEEDNFVRKICAWTEAFRFYFFRNFKKSWHNGKHSIRFSSQDITNPRKGVSFLDQTPRRDLKEVQESIFAQSFEVYDIVMKYSQCRMFDTRLHLNQYDFRIRN